MTGLLILGLMGDSEAPALRSALRASEGRSQATRATEAGLRFSHSSNTLHSHPGVLISQGLPQPCLEALSAAPKTASLRAEERLVSPHPWGLVWQPGFQALVYPFCTLKELQVAAGGAGRPLESPGRTMLPTPCLPINLRVQPPWVGGDAEALRGDRAC